MRRIARLAACQEFGRLVMCLPAVRFWKRVPICWEQPAVQQQLLGMYVRPFSMEATGQRRKLCRQSAVCFSQKHSPFSSQSGADGPPENSEGQPDISVVGIPDPITWIRCKAIMYLIKLYFGVDTNSVEFDKGVKQALVFISNLMSSGSYHRLVGIMSNEMRDYVEKKCKCLTNEQRQQLAVTVDDIIFMVPEDVSVVCDEQGRNFCFFVMRFWLLKMYNGPDDPEATKIFKVAQDCRPRKKIVTAVYEFRSELSRGSSPDWTVTTVWHWEWK